PAGAQTVPIPVEGIYTRDSKGTPRYRSFTIIAESPRAITIKENKEPIAVEDIEDIIFVVEPKELNTGAYRIAMMADKRAAIAAKETDRIKNLAEAATKYSEALKLLKEGQPQAHAQIQFKLANILYRQALTDGKEASRKAANARLKEFTDK